MNGAVALVTGAGRGIGRSTALALRSRGARVMAVSRTESDLQALRAQSDIEYICTSVASADACARIVSETAERLGPIDILVLNAGVDTGREQPVWAQPIEVWDETLRVNLDAAFHLTRAASGSMVDRRSGRIVMVSSTAGEIGGASMSAYCASKHGLLGLMRAVAQDVGAHGVTCNAVAPGWVRTPMAERTAEAEATRRGVSADDVWRERAAAYPAGRVLSPDEVANVIAFLASDEASGINGEVIRIALGGVW